MVGNMSKSGNKPERHSMQIQNLVYKNLGWFKGFGDWLSTGEYCNTRLKVFRPYKEAREFVRKLGIEIGQRNGKTIVQVRQQTK